MSEEIIDCVKCDKPHRFIDNSNHFCSEEHWAEYNLKPVQPEGYYGFLCPDCNHPMDSWKEGVHPTGESQPRVRCKQCRRKWKI